RRAPTPVAHRRRHRRRVESMPGSIVLPVTYPASKLRMLGLLLVSGGFVAAGFWLLGKPGLDRPMSFLSIGFFSLGIVVAAINLHPRAAYLTLTEKGFEFASMFRSHRVAWKDVAEFFPVRISGNEMIGWDYHPDYEKHSVGRKLASSISDV